MARYGVVVALVTLGCSSSDPVTKFDDQSGTTASVDGTERLPYPPPPYGTKPGATIENLQLLGWSDPKAVDGSVQRLEPLSLARFYNADGATSLRFLVITSTAVWCSACKLEYEDFASGRVDQYRARGVEFFGALFEDGDSNPARPFDLKLVGHRMRKSADRERPDRGIVNTQIGAS